VLAIRLKQLVSTDLIGELDEDEVGVGVSAKAVVVAGEVEEEETIRPVG
jgi:hypothetical protein